MNREKILTFIRNNKNYLKEKYGVVKIGLFGSYANNSANLKSDIDIYVELKENKFKYIAGVWNYLEENLGAKVDLFYSRNKNKSHIQESIKKSVIYG